jgi:hypothetical protein
MKGGIRLGEAMAAGLILLAPALWNRFPFLEYDTGGYLARWFEGYLVPSRSTVYGLFAVAGWPLDFWPEVVVQTGAAVWVIGLVLRAYGFGDRPFALVGTVATLALTTALPFLAGILLTDIFAGTAVLALHLLVFAPAQLTRGERIGVALFVAFAASTHSATFAVLAAVVVVAMAARLWWRDVAPGLRRGAVAVALGAALLVGTNFALSGKLAWTPGGYGILFARMVQDGIVGRYLDDHCPDPKIRLCPYRHVLPPTADDFLWGGGGPFDALGRFDGLGEEMRTIVLESLVDYPGAQIGAAVADTAEQLVRVATGEGMESDLYHTYGIIDRYMPRVAPAMRAAHQQRGALDFRALNRLDVPVALLSMLMLPVVMAMARRGNFGDLGGLAATVAVAIVVNAAVCGALSNPHDRYGARMVWIATFAVALVPMRLVAARPRKARLEVAPTRET